MRKIKTGITIFLSLAVSLVTTKAWAACIQADATGKWNLYITTGEVDWLHCLNLSIGATGNIAPGAVCIASDGDKGTITRGQIKVSTSCIATGNIFLGSATVTIKHATFARDKFHFTGVGTTPGDLPKEPAFFNAVKL